MGEVSEGTHESTVVMTAEAISEALEQMAREVIECNAVAEESIALLGILSRGPLSLFPAQPVTPSITFPVPTPLSISQ